MLNLYHMLFSLESISRDSAKLRENIIKPFTYDLSNLVQLDKMVHFFSLVEVQLLMSKHILFQLIQIRLRDVQRLLKVVWIFKNSSNMLSLQDCI